MAKETTKAMKRRYAEEERGGFKWSTFFKGRGLDIGSGDDPLTCAQPFDTPDGDANNLSNYFELESFDYLHGSHVLEHMEDPRAALRDWLTLIKPGGYIIQTVPDWVAYERMQWPSVFNPDHKSSWSMIYKGSIAPVHIHIPSFLAEFSDVATVVLMRYVEENFDWKIPRDVDQTWEPETGCEILNEFVLQKKP
jgi:SAM-dependent methyltransferase